MSDNPNQFSNLSFDELWESYYTDDNIIRSARKLMDDWREEIEGSSSTNIQRRTRTIIERDREEGGQRLKNGYFSQNPVYTDEQFRRRFRMQRNLFARIMDGLQEYSSYFQQRSDATGRLGLSTHLKCTAAIRMLAYGVAGDAVDNYIRIGETTAIECLKNFCDCVIEVFGDEYLRSPTAYDLQRLLQLGEARGFPGMLGSIDCMHWEWKNCPVGWHGQFTRADHGAPTIMLEVVASADLWISHSFFGVAGSNNDVNVLDRSPLFNEVVQGRAPAVHYMVNGMEYDMGYYRADGIYPEWASFVKTIPRPKGAKRKFFSKYQEAARKDVERAFGVLQSRFVIIKIAARLWNRVDLGKIMKACIILHNMIVEDERDTYMVANDFNYENADEGIKLPRVSTNRLSSHFNEFLENNRRLRDKTAHRALQADLVEHLWQKFGSENDVN